MKRIAILGGLAAALSATAIAVAAAPARDSLPLSGFVCQTALDPSARAIQVEAVMRPLAGTKHMALRFDLLSRNTPGGALTAVPGGDLGTWISPGVATLGQRPGDRWIVKKQVINLAAPASYHFVVTFRWTGKHGRSLGARTLSSRSCYQPELRSDLVVRAVRVTPAHNPARDHYTALIANTGATAATSFQVQFNVGAATPLVKTIASLPGHSHTLTTVTAAACSPGTAITVTADPAQAVDVSSRNGSSVTVACP